MNPQEKDEKIFNQFLRILNKKESLKIPPSQSLLEIGRLFVNKPYQSATLETNRNERLSINLREFDCVTFVENVLALYRLLRSRRRSFKSFQKILQKIRYRGGRLRGYASRLHYFSDWIYDNQRKGFLRDITSEMGGKPFRKSIHYMTSHPELYPPLKNPRVFEAIRSVERKMGRRALSFIPKEGGLQLEGGIGDGDLIAITSHQEGLDVEHVGLAVRVKNRIYLLHASSKEGKIVLSQKTLYRYLMENRDYSGLMVARVLNP